MNKLEIIPVARSLFRAYELHCTYIIDFYILPLTRFNSTAPIISCTVAAILGKRSIPLRAYITSASLAAKVKKYDALGITQSGGLPSEPLHQLQHQFTLIHFQFQSQFQSQFQTPNVKP